MGVFKFIKKSKQSTKTNENGTKMQKIKTKANKEDYLDKVKIQIKRNGINPRI